MAVEEHVVGIHQLRVLDHPASRRSTRRDGIRIQVTTLGERIGEDLGKVRPLHQQQVASVSGNEGLALTLPASSTAAHSAALRSVWRSVVPGCVPTGSHSSCACSGLWTTRGDMTVNLASVRDERLARGAETTQTRERPWATITGSST